VYIAQQRKGRELEFVIRESYRDGACGEAAIFSAWGQTPRAF
jgi:hypothetical protein